MAETHLALRGNAADPRFLEACEKVLGARPPTVPNTVNANILWLGPDEWLIVGKLSEKELKEGLRGIHSAVVDVSSSRAVIELAGPDAEEVLSKAATLDFHPRAFPVGACAQTNIARAQGILHRAAEQHFRIYVRTSFARYLEQWLSDAQR